MACFGISGNLLDWFKSYLSDSRQRVVLNGCNDWARVCAGVPQGSVLGPLLFLIYIIDIVNEIQCVIRLFADATSLYIIVENPAFAAASLNIDLAYISVTEYRYIKRLYCLVVQAGFYKDAIACWIFVRRVAGSILGRVRSKYFFSSTVTFGAPV